MTTVAVVTDQPKGGMEMGPVSQQLPASVEYLKGLDTIIVRQKMEIFEALSGVETKNRYQILNKDFQEIFFAREESNECERIMCSPTRGFRLNVTDNENKNIMRFIREFKYCTGCCCCAEGCCSMVVAAESPFGRNIGKIALANSKCDSHVRIFDSDDRHLFTIWVPCCFCQDGCCPADVIFPVTDPSLTTEVGKMAKVFRGCCVEAIGDADTFRLEIPHDLDLNKKILLIGAVFFIDYLRFEQK
ncbi:phospholipid scramblase 1-like [Ruditapes philippinarum]|uniref:phospholipid scramblase 1-like n=1 Tax=Ruditapes philippinarum TaxID=129788 RepID=UPI00295B7D18|nr:phospholipid scramblase 1-like [Ruditapes philippinarum]